MPPVTCKQAELWISLKVDGELGSSGLESSLETHLAECFVCRIHFDKELARSSKLRDLLLLQPEELGEFRGEILRRALQASPGQILQRSPARPPTWGLFASAAALFVVSGWVGWNLWPSRDGDPQAPSGSDLVGSSSVGPAGFRFVLEERLEDSQVVPDEQGRPVRREVERVRLWPLSTERPQLAPLQPSSSSKQRPWDVNGGVGWEQIKARNVQLVSWPYQ